jgi:hypothetical protein
MTICHSSSRVSQLIEDSLLVIDMADGCAQDEPLFFSESKQGGDWRCSKECVFVEEAIDDPRNLRESNQKKELSSKLTAILRMELLPVVVLPSALLSALKSYGENITSASPSFVRDHYKKQSRRHLSLEDEESGRANLLSLLKYAIRDISKEESTTFPLFFPFPPSNILIVFRSANCIMQYCSIKTYEKLACKG